MPFARRDGRGRQAEDRNDELADHGQRLNHSMRHERGQLASLQTRQSDRPGHGTED